MISAALFLCMPGKTKTAENSAVLLNNRVQYRKLLKITIYCGERGSRCFIAVGGNGLFLCGLRGRNLCIKVQQGSLGCFFVMRFL